MSRVLRSVLFIQVVALTIFLCADTEASVLDIKDSINANHGASIHDELKRSAIDIRYFNNLTIQTTAYNSDPIVLPSQVLDDSTEHYRSQAFAYQTEVLRRNAFIGNLNNLSLLELPVGLSRPGGDINYTIIISQVSVGPAGALLDAYFIFELPQTGDKIAFRGKNIKFSYDGGLAGDGRLELIGSYPLKVNEKTLLTILGKGNTYVEFNCDGFKGMGIEAEVEFSRDLIIPENDNGTQKPLPERVKTKFAVHAQSWNDILVSVNLPPFQINGLKDFGFSVTEAYMDWSDLVNPPGLIFPKDYNSTFTEGGQAQLWQGFYLKRVDVRLPASFAKKNSNARITFGVEDMILDDAGFSGNVFGENIIEAGDMAGWSYTLDRIGVALVTNQVKGFEIAGKLAIPVIKSKDGKVSQFGYLAQRSADGNYLFAVKIENEVKLPLFVADAKLFTGSAVIVAERENKFYPSARLNGELTIRALSKGPKASFNSIRFENMVISSEAPHFRPGSFGFGKEGEASSVSKYPVVINNIMVKSENNRTGIGFDLTVNIGGGAEDEGFGGTASLTLWAKQEPEEIKDAEGAVVGIDKGAWKFDKVEMTGVGISVKKPGVIDLSGMINFFDDDPTYGDGFRGRVSGKIQSITVQADALFGRTTAFRYWFADALIGLESGIVIMPGVVSAYGFGGGYFYKMKQSTQRISSTLGTTQSGITYVPDENTIGIRAIVLIGAARKEAWNGDVALEVALNRHGGINSVTFTGNANFMTPMPVDGGKIKEMVSSSVGGKLTEKLASLIRGQVYGSIRLHFDNVNDIFHGNLEIYVNVAGGLLQGASSGNKAGWAVLHFERNNWYVLIGTPDQPIGLKLKGLFQARSYVMLGNNIPGSPPPPEMVSSIIGDMDPDYMRDLNSLESGLGYAFGLQFGFDTGDITFLMFYGRFGMTAGVDFMLKEYKNCYCKNTGRQLGIDGWYANGQAYAAIIAKIGIKVKLKFIRGNFDIINMRLAALLQMKGPNPVWMHGTIAGDYNILGGLVKGHCNFKATIGEECDMTSPNGGEINPLADVTIIADMSPTQSEENVSVFVSPQVAFNIPIGQLFDISDENGENRRLFRGRLEKFEVLDGSTSLAGSIRWNDTNDVLAFTSFEILPGEKQLKASVRVIFEEYVNGGWNTMYFEGKPLEERKEISFTTGKEPDYIPLSTVDISYPAIGQFNFYPREYNRGFIELKQGRQRLFANDPLWIKKVRLIDAVSQTYLETDLSYVESEKRIYFNIPSNLQTSKAYKIEILNFPRQTQLVDANVKSSAQKVSADGQEMTLTTKDIEGNVELKEAKQMYSALFKTSGFNTFKEKITAITLSQTFRHDLGANVYQLLAYMEGKELFDKSEISGPLADRSIQFEAILDPNDWYQKEVFPLVYQGFPLLSDMVIRYRKPEAYGFPPVKAIDLYQVGYEPVITEQDLAPVFTPVSRYNPVRYDLMVPMISDYYDIQNQIGNYIIDNPTMKVSDRLYRLIVEPFPIYNIGRYRMKVKYVIPRINQTTSVHEWELYNTMPK